MTRLQLQIIKTSEPSSVREMRPVECRPWLQHAAKASSTNGTLLSREQIPEVSVAASRPGAPSAAPWARPESSGLPGVKGRQTAQG